VIRIVRYAVVFLTWPAVYLADRARGIDPPVSLRSALGWARYGIYPPTIPTADHPAIVRRAAGGMDAEMDQVVADHEAAYHPGRSCRENERGECADRQTTNPRGGHVAR
jgi:hypothetical protein